jgi:UDP-N-acetylmuramoyl-tripeptide--D-alanyl-D-alanine ligase
MNQIKKIAKRLFQYEARLVLKKYKPKIIAITGSVGKTTTRDFLYSVLSKKFFVRKSERSFTTELGLPLTILGCAYGKGAVLKWLQNLWTGFLLIVWRRNYPDWLILEIDADKPGDVDSIAGWLSVDILLVTAIGSVPSHIEAFGSDIEKFLAEKKKLFESVSRDGVIVYNGDDETVCRLVFESSLKKISCGLSADCNPRGSDFEILTSVTGGLSKPTGMRFDVFSGEEKITVNIMDSVGIHNEYAVLLSVAVSDLLMIPMTEAVKTVEKSPLLPGRMKIIAGIKDSTVIDDSYNSSPAAVRQAVEVFGRLPTTGRKIAVVGDMLELGKYSAEEHREVGRLLSPVANYVVCVGLRARRVAEAMLSLSYDENNISCFDTAVEAGKFLQNMLEPGDLVLVKGSQIMRLEKVVEEVMRHPEDKKTLLVRQEPEWLERE